MANTPYLWFTRRMLLAGLAGLPAQALAAPKIVTVLGDSITAGYGLASRVALPARLEAELARIGSPAKVRGAGVSGDTTAGGLARLDYSVQADTAVCVVALGGNDLLRGLEPGGSKANLDKIIRRLKARRITTVLVGLRAPPMVGRAYAREFSAIFPALAKAHGVALLPDLLEGVAGVARLNQRDSIHPNAAGVEIIAKRLAPLVAKALAR